MNWTRRRTHFRNTIESGQCIHPGSVYDPLSARAAEDLGFEMGMVGGVHQLVSTAIRLGAKP